MKASLIYCYLFVFIFPIDRNNSADFFRLARTGSMEKPNESFGQLAANDRWINLFNNKIESIDSLYLPNSIILSPNGVIYDKPKARTDFYKNFKKSTGDIKSITTINKTVITSDVSYEIGFFVTDKNIKYKHLIIWKKIKGSFLREFEMFGKSEDLTADIVGINAIRNTWMELCNSHKVKELVTNTYFENAVYYNNNRLTVSTENIVKEYHYMSNPSYQLTLTPISLEVVNEVLAFEVGQCSGSYKGRYILVWGKRTGSSWKVIFDSN